MWMSNNDTRVPVWTSHSVFDVLYQTLWTFGRASQVKWFISETPVGVHERTSSETDGICAWIWSDCNLLRQSQTPNSGLRHTSSGGRCRKAVFGVWRQSMRLTASREFLFCFTCCCCFYINEPLVASWIALWGMVKVCWLVLTSLELPCEGWLKYIDLTWPLLNCPVRDG